MGPSEVSLIASETKAKRGARNNNPAAETVMSMMRLIRQDNWSFPIVGSPGGFPVLTFARTDGCWPSAVILRREQPLETMGSSGGSASRDSWGPGPACITTPSKEFAPSRERRALFLPAHRSCRPLPCTLEHSAWTNAVQSRIPVSESPWPQKVCPESHRESNGLSPHRPLQEHSRDAILRSGAGGIFDADFQSSAPLLRAWPPRSRRGSLFPVRVAERL